MMLAAMLAAPLMTVSIEPKSFSLAAGQNVVAVKATLPQGWHTYWHNPGESGMATKVKLVAPKGWSVDPLAWPTPERIEANGEVSYGYEDAVTFYFRVRPGTEVRPVRVQLSATVDALICRESCVPAKASVSRTLPVIAGKTPLSAAVDLLPKVWKESGITVQRRMAAGKPTNFVLAPALPEGTLIFERDGLIDVPKPIIRRADGTYLVPSAYASPTIKTFRALVVVPGHPARELSLPITELP